MRLTLLTSTAVAIAITTAGASGQTREPSSPPDRPGAAGAPAQGAGATTDTRTFIDHMAVAGMAEVQLGKLASDRAADADVKAFGQMMVTDHTKANEELMQVATRAGAQPPKQLDAKHQQLVDKLSKLRGADFDREYVSAMVMGHEEVAAMLRSKARGADPTLSARPSAGTAAGTSGSARTDTGNAGSQSRPAAPAAGAVGAAGAASVDDAAAQWAAKALPTVQQHLERARALQQRVAR